MIDWLKIYTFYDILILIKRNVCLVCGRETDGQKSQKWRVSAGEMYLTIYVERANGYFGLGFM